MLRAGACRCIYPSLTSLLILPQVIPGSGLSYHLSLSLALVGRELVLMSSPLDALHAYQERSIHTFYLPYKRWRRQRNVWMGSLTMTGLARSRLPSGVPLPPSRSTSPIPFSFSLHSTSYSVLSLFSVFIAATQRTRREVNKSPPEGEGGEGRRRELYQSEATPSRSGVIPCLCHQCAVKMPFLPAREGHLSLMRHTYGTVAKHDTSWSCLVLPHHSSNEVSPVDDCCCVISVASSWDLSFLHRHHRQSS